MGGRLAATLGVSDAGEPRGELRALASQLRGTAVEGTLALRSIDEVPVLAVAATQARGRTHFRDLAELRVKESDRIAAVASCLRAHGAQVIEHEDGFSVDGPMALRPARGEVASGDHRVVMSAVVAALCARGESLIPGGEPVDVSFPGFYATLRALGAELTAVGPA
jgi:3-phosphoshikimate 1-carboxyvinyltransferase